MSRVVIAETGGTKSEWVKIVNGREDNRLISSGINCARLAGRLLTASESAFLEDVDELHLFAAGFSLGHGTAALDSLFETIPTRRYKSDVDAAVDAHRVEDGVVVLLGTGSQAALVRSSECISSLPSLGYLISDEGSGYAMGRQLIRDYIYGYMPSSSTHYLENHQDVSRSTLLAGLYAEGSRASFIASFAAILSSLPDQEYVNNLVVKELEEFVEVRIAKAFHDLLKTNELVYAVGGIASAYKQVLGRLLQKRGWQLQAVTARPIDFIVNTYLEGSNK